MSMLTICKWLHHLLGQERSDRRLVPWSRARWLQNMVVRRCRRS